MFYTSCPLAEYEMNAYDIGFFFFLHNYRNYAETLKNLRTHSKEHNQEEALISSARVRKMSTTIITHTKNHCNKRVLYKPVKSQNATLEIKVYKFNEKFETVNLSL